MSWSNVLADYAKKDPSSLPEGVLHSFNAKTLTIFDGYEKAEYHFLSLPRAPFVTLGSVIAAKEMSSLESVLKLKNGAALEILKALNEAGQAVKKEIEKEMMEKLGWIGPIHLGFHGSESMQHVHLHVISGDLISPKLKNKKHYNSFNPKLNFFHPISEIIEALEKKQKFQLLTVKEYETILKGPLVSFYTGEEFKTIPKLKVHLESEWKKLGNRTKAEMESSKKKRDGEEEEGGGESENRVVSKKVKI